MTANELWQICQQVRETKPLIHGITNPISIHSSANAILAVGGRPMMAEHPKEVKEVAASAQGLVLNLGNLTEVRKKSMRLAAGQGTPFVIDLVGVSCSSHRRRYAKRLLSKTTPAMIKGNYSEILAMAEAGYQASGVDADSAVTQSQVQEAAVALASRYHTVVLASGKVDFITDGKRKLTCQNGTRQLTSITGTGCMLGMLCGCYLAAGDGFLAAAAACAVLGIAGELAETGEGSGSFETALMNHLSVQTKEVFLERVKIDEEEF